MGKSYVILNAALDTESWIDWALKSLYQTCTFIKRTKFSKTHIVDICRQPSFENLSSEDIEAIRNADKILIAGHCYQDRVLRDRLSSFYVHPEYIAELLANVLNHGEYRPRQISLVACESVMFGKELIGCFTAYPNLVQLIVTARKYEIALDVRTGRKLNNITTGKRDSFFHHSQTQVTYKTRYSIEPVRGDILEEDIAGTWSP